MLAKVILAIAGGAVIASAQAPPAELQRVLTCAQADTPQTMQQIADILRTIANLPQVAVDGGRKTITVTSSRAQTELGEWIFQLLESAPPRSGSSEYTMPGNSDDVVRVAFLSRRTGPRELQEVINAVRSIVEVQRIGAVTAAGAVVLRGTVRQGNLADWLIQQLENPPAGASPGSYTAAGLDPTFHNRGLAEPNAVRVYSMSPERTPDLQAALEEIRNQVQVMRIVACPGARVIVLRGTEAQAQGADRILMKTGK